MHVIRTGSQVVENFKNGEHYWNVMQFSRGKEERFKVPGLFQARLAESVGNVVYCSGRAWIGAWTIPALLWKDTILTKHLQSKNNFLEVSKSQELSSGPMGFCYHESQDIGLGSGTYSYTPQRLPGASWNRWSKRAWRELWTWPEMCLYKV